MWADLSHHHQSYHHCVVCKLNDGVAGVSRSTVSGVERVELRAKHTPLWAVCAQCPGVGEVGAKFDWGWFVRKSLIQEKV